MSSKRKYLIVIAGPTASGKTSIAIQLAKHFNTEILSCDSRQLYREMSIGTAKPSAEELESVKHHFINSHSILEDYDAGKYEQDANELLGQLFNNKDVVVMAGGTGLFIKAALEGLDVLPTKSEEIREHWQKIYDAEGVKPLQDHLQTLDPEKFGTMDQYNPQRLIRAIEICEQSGKTHAQLQSSQKKNRPYSVIKIALSIPREKLYQRIDDRVDAMLDQGLLEEVKSLVAHSSQNALKTVGYNEIFDALSGNFTMDEAVDKIKQHSRNYAKRQITWFKKMNMTWLSPFDYESILAHVESEIN
jgi:tRNA dimethylallyltransferase